jgi:hypothetical protein
MNEPPHIAFRLTTLLFASLLGFQSIWLLITELYQPGIYRLPTNPADAIKARNGRGDAALAAMIGAIRGDLWAESAYTYAYLLFSESAETANEGLTLSLAQARAALDHALGDAPHESGAWLLRAGLSLRYPSFGFNALEALKMSYYTGPSEQDLMPLRLRVAVQLVSFDDIEIRQFVRRDVRLLLARKQKPAIADAYNAASPSGKRFIEQTVSDIDPSALGSLRGGVQKQSLPD